WSPKSAIPVRILARSEGEALDSAFLGRRLDEAAKWRRELLDLPNAETTGFRLVHAEGDELAGLIVDVFGQVAVVQLLTAGMKRRETDIFAHVARVTGAKTIVEVASERMQRLEGFEATTGIVRGPDVDRLKFRERGFDLEVPLSITQKTGYYFDQRDNRARVESLAKGRRVLDAYSFVGGFSIAAVRGGAESVVAMDSSAPAIATGATIAAHHGYGDLIEFQKGDVKRALPELNQKGTRFGMVIIDPPKLAPTSRHLDAGRKAYRRLNAAALRIVEEDGLLVTCSCSGAVKSHDFLRTIGLAAKDARRRVSLIYQGHQGADHPTPAAFPEGRYLKCAILRVL
ncbi:MAG: class I SAM-dependent rRNA methyltransferase, partial [Deltaproteobacteria bacterium]|nr:class I SAM-dependent rRNA methyltransferase [Deltaproteobacteria bacterium]